MRNFTRAAAAVVTAVACLTLAPVPTDGPGAVGPSGEAAHASAASTTVGSRPRLRASADVAREAAPGRVRVLGPKALRRKRVNGTGRRVSARGAVFAPDGKVRIPPRVRARAWMLADLDTGEVLATYRGRTRQHPASTIKLLTALTALDHTPRRVRATRFAARRVCSCAGVKRGRRYARRALLAGALLHSGNDAAETLAAGHPQGRRAFYRAMQRRAHALGATSTTVGNASGLTHPRGRSTAHDLLVILRAAVAEPRLVTVMTRGSARFGPVRGRKHTVWQRTSYVADVPGSLGKSGFTTPAQNTLVVSTPVAGRRIGVAVLGTRSGETNRGASALTRWASRHPGRLETLSRLP